MTIDLGQFCGQTKGYGRPFSQGEWTYATDRSIMVRVPRMADVPYRPEIPQSVAKLFPDTSAVTWRPFVMPRIPDIGMIECSACDGRGREHDCPNCYCICEVCDGEGRVLGYVTIGLGGRIFAARYMRMIAGIPGIEVPVGSVPDPMPFRFAGGEGIVMAMSGKSPVHIEEPV